MGFASELIKSQLFITPPYPTCSFQGQTVIVTGSNQGLGFEALKHIVRLNCTKAIMAVRSLEKGKTAKQTIEQSLNIQSDVIEVWELDLSSFSSVMSFAARVDKCLPRVDALIENAGIATKAFRRLEGNESTITVNVLSTVLLALLLLPKMQRTSVEYCVSPRITVVSSETHFLAKFKEKNAHKIFEALDIEKSADMGDR
jgi:NAD(P)-dependent dehydrogenase (short-subunit alcohol dehydrogenase family)